MESPTGNSSQQASQSVEQIQQLLQAKDDTSRFVALALLKSTLDNSQDLQENKDIIVSLWESIPPKFLDRLLRTGSDPQRKDGKDMLDLAVAVLHTFSLLLPDGSKSDSKLLRRIPRLIEALLQSSEETTILILKTILTLVSSSPEGAKAVAEVEDLSPLIEIAPKHQYALDILAWSWIQGTPDVAETRDLRRQGIDNTISALVASYKGTDAVTLLDFVAKVLGRLDEDLIPPDPKWLTPIVDMIRKLSTSRPTSAARDAYTNCAARLLTTYPEPAIKSLFAESSTSSTPFSYLFINLIIVDIRASLPTLLEKLNTPEYPAMSTRITSALVILASFIGFLLRQMELLDSADASFSSAFNLSPDLILKLSRSISETLSLIMEYLRDRWDAAVAGAQGLHPEARYGESHTASGSHLTLAWDTKNDSVDEDPLLLAALRVLALWLREDDGETLRKEALGLMDMLLDLYQTKSDKPVATLAREPVLLILGSSTQSPEGLESLLEHDGWTILSQDLIGTLSRAASATTDECDLGEMVAERLSAIAESRRSTPEDWLDFVTKIVTLPTPFIEETARVKPEVQSLWAEVLHLAASLLVGAPPGIKKRYMHSASALVGIVAQVGEQAEGGVREQAMNVIAMIRGDPVFGAT